MCLDDIRMMGAALSPISIILFASEMASMDGMRDMGRLSDRAQDARVAFYVLKLPASILLPALLAGWGLAAMAVIDIVSVVNIVREQTLLARWNAFRRKLDGRDEP